MVDQSMAYRVASKRTAGAALAGLIASILSSVEHATTWAAVPLHLDKRPPLVIQLVTLCHRRSPGARAQPPLCALIAASGLAVQGTPEWRFCVGRLA
jgi:hypothetical protein